jgi:low temperature requirement protein LtrA
VGYSWLTTAIQVDNDIRSRLVVFGAMGGMLVMGLAVPHAFGEDGVLFGAAYLVVTVLFLLLYSVTTRDNPAMHRAVLLIVPGVLLSPILVLTAGFFDAGWVRALLWTLALIVTLGAPFVSGTSGWQVRPAHFAERHGLIIIIALGESLVALGLSASGENLNTAVISASTLGLVLICMLWWLYFDVVSLVGEIRLKRLTGAARNALARDSYSYLHLLLILGIVLVALGLKKTLIDLGDPLKAIPVWALFGGVALYLLGHIAFRYRNIGKVNVYRVVAMVLLLALAPLGVNIPALASLSIVCGVLVVLIVVETIHYRELRHYLRHH